MWGGSLVENVVQALARIIVGEQMLKINERYRVVLTVHDAAVVVVKKEELDAAMQYIVEVMSTPPQWATGLPVACEAKHGVSYGEC
jgi:DNA polymerase